MRIRSIKPEFWSSDDITALHWYERLLLIGLWSYVDDNGVGRDRLASIAGDLFSGDVEKDPQETFARIATGLDKLEAKGRIARYEVDGGKYLAINGWHHQRIDKPGKARYPRPEDSRQSRDTLASAARGPQSVTASTPAPTSTPAEGGTQSTQQASTPTAEHQAAETALTGDSSGARDSDAASSRQSRDTLAPGTGEQGNRGTGEISSSEAADAASDGDRPTIPISAEAKLLADLLLSLMAKNDEWPRSDKPTKKWLESAERMIRIDGRDPAVAMGVLRWAKQDDFWAPNIKSIPTFREKYDQLLAASKRGTGAAGPKRKSVADQIRARQAGGAS